MRIDDSKPNASEQANRDERNRQNVKQKDPAFTSQTAQQAASKQGKDFKSLFDQALDKSKSLDQPTQAEAAKFDAKIKDALSDDKENDRNRSSDRKKDKSEDKKALSSEEKDSGRTQKEGAVKDRILGKQNSGGQGSGSGSSSDGRGDSSSQFGQRQGKQAVKTDELAPTAFQNQQIQSLRSVAALQNVQSLQKIPTQILDQIVQYIRVGVNKSLDKEIQIDLSERIFKGLSLKVSSHQGVLQISFVTTHADVRRLFESSKQNLQMALEQKGLKVGNIKVSDRFSA